MHTASSTKNKDKRRYYEPSVLFLIINHPIIESIRPV